MYMYMYIYIYIYISTYLYIYVYIYIYIYMRKCRSRMAKNRSSPRIWKVIYICVSVSFTWLKRRQSNHGKRVHWTNFWDVFFTVAACFEARNMGWLWFIGSLKLYVSFTKEPYKRDDVLQKQIEEPTNFQEPTNRSHPMTLCGSRLI